MELFGFEIKRKEDQRDTKENMRSFVEPAQEDGALTVTAGGTYGTYVDLDGTAKNDSEQITRYRNMVLQPEVQKAVEDIVNDAIVYSPESAIVECVTDDLDLSDSIKTKIRNEFDNVLRLLDFNNKGYDVFTKWYVDGRLFYHAVIDESNIGLGIKELRPIDPRKIRKIREMENVRQGQLNRKIVKSEYYMYNERGFDQKAKGTETYTDANAKGIKIAKDSIVYCTSGLVNEKNSVVLSHLHKAIKPMNQLRMLEDAAVVYRLARAPERRIFYVDVGTMPPAKASQYLRDMMAKHKNRLVYDATTGEVRDDRKFMTMLEDFWLPRRGDGKSTEITNLPGGANLGEMDDIIYFQKKLFQSLNVPISRLETENAFTLGRASEITRDEVKFARFIDRLRNRFSNLFDKVLEKQLVLKGIISPEEWPDIQNSIRYDFLKDSHFEEMKNAEIIQNRLSTLRDANEYVGVYFSKEYVRKNILHQTEDDIKEIDKQIKKEESGEYEHDAEIQVMRQPINDMGQDDEQDQKQPADPEPKPKPEPKPEANTATANTTS